MGISAMGCAAHTPQLISPEEAQDRVYDHLSRAEAFRMYRQPKLASIERHKAREYRELIRAGKTTTPEQALAAAAQHRRRAQTLRSTGQTKFVGAELQAARRYEDFARRAGRISPVRTGE
jgi:hypothetical protein